MPGKRGPKGPYKNKFDVARMQRLYTFIYSLAQKNGMDEYEMPIRIRQVLRSFFDAGIADDDPSKGRYLRAAGHRSWLAKIRDGERASIDPAGLWALIYSSAHEIKNKTDALTFTERIERDQKILKLHKKVSLSLLDVTLMRQICTIIHYAVSPDFGNPQLLESKKKILLERKGPEIYHSHYSKEWLYPMLGILQPEDLAIDIGEMITTAGGEEPMREDTLHAAQALLEVFEKKEGKLSDIYTMASIELKHHMRFYRVFIQQQVFYDILHAFIINAAALLAGRIHHKDIYD